MAEMTLRTYRARTMADALTEVKKDLGRDAVILHTRSYRVGGWFGFGAKPIVEITASSGDQRSPARTHRRDPAATSAALRRAYALERSAPEPQTAKSEAVREPTTQQSPDRRPALEQPAVEPSPVRLEPVAAQIRDDQPIHIERELESIKQMVGRVLHTSQATMVDRAPRVGAMPDALFNQYMKLLQSDVAGDIVDEIIGTVRDELSGAELRDEAVVRAAVIRHIAALIPVADEVPTCATEGKPLTIAMIGPTGVGKTTTVAKLAAAYKLRHAKRVGLVTTDTYRIAAVDQLRTYANIIGVPLKVAMTPAEMSQACDSLSACDVILLDTAGRSQNDTERLGELRLFLQAAKPDQTHLLLSSTSSQRVLVEAAQRFGTLGPNRVVFTKLDEAVNYGVLLDVARRMELAVSYVTTGQEVPDHIEVARSDRMARLVLDGAVAQEIAG